MNILGAVILIVAMAYVGYQVYGIIKDIKKRRTAKKKKAESEAQAHDEKDKTEPS